MKKRHQQKLVILSIGLIIFLNLPIIYIFNVDKALMGIPVLYAYVFIVWSVSIIITCTVINRYA